MNKMRIERLQKYLHERKLDGMIIENPIDLLYLTGLKLSRGRLWISPRESQLLVDARYFDEAQMRSPCSVKLWAKGQKVPVFGSVGHDSNWTTVAHLEELQTESVDAKFVSIAQPLKGQRLIKDAEEIKALREAARVTWEGMQHIRTLFKVGISEQELALEFEFFVRRLGASGLAFDTIIAFGENSAYPHHQTSKTCLKNDQVILIDAGAMVDQYCADVTRVFSFGKMDPRLDKMQEIVRKADIAARKEVRIGRTIGSLDRAARDVFSGFGVEAEFTHSLGHGIGLETHECPFIRFDGEDRDIPVSVGMAIAIEPGLYRPHVGGIRYENSGLVTRSGFESFYPEN